jgi:hypothetical protein
VDTVDPINVRKTHLKTSWATGFYAVCRGLLKFAVSMRMGEPYLGWERDLERDP